MISIRSIVIESFYYFGTFYSNRVIFFSKSQHIFPHLFYSLFISLPFSFSTLLSFILTHLTQFFLIYVSKRNASITKREEVSFYEWINDIIGLIGFDAHIIFSGYQIKYSFINKNCYKIIANKSEFHNFFD